MFGIDPEKYDHLMVERFDAGRDKEGRDFHLSYAIEWAQRVRSGYHFAAADTETSAVLKEAGYSRGEA